MPRKKQTSQAPSSQLADRYQALEEALQAGQGLIDPQLQDQAQALLASVAGRRELSADHTVVGFFGATGSGKSSLFNAVVGQNLAATAVRRPTTSQAQAAVWGAEGAEPLLDWLQVSKRNYLEGDQGLILLDLPDFDSVQLENRQLVERMAACVDALVWVFDPQKYADAMIHQDFIRPLASHGAVTLAVLNQADRLDAQQEQAVLASLSQLLRADGLELKLMDAPLAVSTKSGYQVDQLRQLLFSLARSKQAAQQRLEADLVTLAQRLKTQDGGPEPEGLSDQEALIFEEALGRVAGVPTLLDAAAQSYRRSARASTGWVVTRWTQSLTKDPLKRLGLGREESKDSQDLTGEGQILRRSSLPSWTSAQKSALATASRACITATSGEVQEPWASSIRQAALSRQEDFEPQLERALFSLDYLRGKKPLWQRVLSSLQWLAAAAALLGLLWLTGLALGDFFQLPLEAPRPEGFPLPLPTLLLISGLALGLALSLLGRTLASWTVKSYRRRLEAEANEALARVANNCLYQPLEEGLERLYSYRQALERASRP